MRPAIHPGPLPGVDTRSLRLGLRIVVLGCIAAVLSGCQGMSRVQPVSQVRVIDGSPDAPAIDIHQNASTGLYNVAFGTVSSYISVPAGEYTHTAYTAGTRQQLAAVQASLLDGAQYTVLTGNTAAALQMTILRDQSTPAPAGKVALRVLNQTTRAGAFDLYLLPAGSPLTAAVPLATRAGFGANTGYRNTPAGTYSILAFRAGSIPTIASPLYTGAQTAYPSGAVRTLILIDQAQRALPAGRPFGPALQIITATDFNPASAS